MEYTFSAKATLKYSADVIVVGGGLAGCAAAIAAARNGADTLLIESTGMVGGLATLGYVLPFDATTKRNGEPFGGIVTEIEECTRNLTKNYGGPDYYLLKASFNFFEFSNVQLYHLQVMIFSIFCSIFIHLSHTLGHFKNKTK